MNALDHTIKKIARFDLFEQNWRSTFDGSGIKEHGFNKNPLAWDLIEKEMVKIYGSIPVSRDKSTTIRGHVHKNWACICRPLIDQRKRDEYAKAYRAARIKARKLGFPPQASNLNDQLKSFIGRGDFYFGAYNDLVGFVQRTCGGSPAY